MDKFDLDLDIPAHGQILKIGKIIYTSRRNKA